MFTFKTTPAFKQGKTIEQYKNESSNGNPLLLATLTYQNYTIECLAEWYWKEKVIFTFFDRYRGVEGDSHRTFTQIYSPEEMFYSMFIVLHEMVPELPIDVVKRYYPNVENAEEKSSIYVQRLEEVLLDSTCGTIPIYINRQVQESNVDVYCYYSEHPKVMSLIQQSMNNLREEILEKKTL